MEIIIMGAKIIIMHVFWLSAIISNKHFLLNRWKIFTLLYGIFQNYSQTMKKMFYLKWKVHRIVCIKQTWKSISRSKAKEIFFIQAWATTARGKLLQLVVVVCTDENNINLSHHYFSICSLGNMNWCRVIFT